MKTLTFALTLLLSCATAFAQAPVMTNDGIDRALDALLCTGEAVSTAFVSLHTGAPPTTSNEISGNNYDSEQVTGSWTLSTPESGIRRIALPAVAFNSPTNAWSRPTHLALTLGGDPGNGTLVFYWPISVAAPQSGAAVNMANGAVFIEIDLMDTSGAQDFEISIEASDRLLRGLSGSAAVDACISDDRWGLHSAHPTNNAPAEITGTAYGDQAAVAWTSSRTISVGYRGRYAGAVDWPDPQSNWTIPTQLAYWDGAPGEANSEVLVVWDIQVQQPMTGGDVDIEANTVYVELQITGTLQ